METDPAVPATSERLARSLRTGRLTVAGMDTGNLDVALVGVGESYAAWLVRVGEQRLLWRFPRREPEEMPRPMAHEFAAMRQVPADLGTRGIAMEDTTDNPLGMRYLASTYVPGRVLGADQWTGEHLVAHAGQMAALHRRVHAGCGPVGERNDGRIDHGDLVATNIVVDDAGTPRFIDWEWAEIGDVAQDLAYIGGEGTAAPGTCR